MKKKFLAHPKFGDFEKETFHVFFNILFKTILKVEKKTFVGISAVNFINVLCTKNEFFVRRLFFYVYVTRKSCQNATFVPKIHTFNVDEIDYWKTHMAQRLKNND